MPRGGRPAFDVSLTNAVAPETSRGDARHRRRERPGAIRCDPGRETEGRETEGRETEGQRGRRGRRAGRSIIVGIVGLLASSSVGAPVDMASIRTVTATRYVTPLRQGGSLPAIVEADDDGLYVVKFRGAAQGVRSLVAELIAGEIARALELLVPELVYVELDPVLARSEPDPEIQELIVKSAGLNVGLDYLPGAIGYHPLTSPPDADIASAVVWLDAYVTNVDRTVRNPNLLLWHQRIWLIDHGAALYFHYSWDGSPDRARDPFPQISRHVLLPYASDVGAADADAVARLRPDVLRAIVDLVPDGWLDEPRFATPAEHRDAYVRYLTERLVGPRPFLETIEQARAAYV
jgi:hypothetical protein